MSEGNPFGQGPTGQNYFVARDDEIAIVTSRLAGLASGRPIHFFVAGRNGTGKTSLLRRLEELGQIYDPPILVAKKICIQNESGWDQFHRLLLEAARGLDRQSASGLEADVARKKESVAFKTPRTERLEAGDVRDDLDYLTAEMRARNLPSVVFALDEAQFVSSDLLSVFKAAVEDRKNYLIVLIIRVPPSEELPTKAARRILDETVTSGGGDLGAVRYFGNGVDLGPFRDNGEVDACIKRRLAGTQMSFSDEAVKDISFVSERVPYKVVTISSHIFDMVQHAARAVADVDDVEKSFASQNPDLVDRAGAILDVVSPLGKPALVKLSAHADWLSRGMLEASISDESPALTQGQAVGTLTDLLGELSAHGLLREESDGVSLVTADVAYSFRYALEHG